LEVLPLCAEEAKLVHVAIALEGEETVVGTFSMVAVETVVARA
jgi:hypothetical protein